MNEIGSESKLPLLRLRLTALLATLALAIAGAGWAACGGDDDSAASGEETGESEAKSGEETGESEAKSGESTGESEAKEGEETGEKFKSEFE